MATHAGHEGLVKIGANTVAEVVDFNFEQSVSPVEDTELSDTHKTFLTGGKKETNGSITCQWDETDTNGQEAMTIDAEVTLNLYPEGDTSGDSYWTGSAIITKVGVANNDGETVKRSFEWIANGAFTLSTVV